MPQDREVTVRRGRGAPLGNTNALKHGGYVRAVREMMAAVRERRRAARAAIATATALLEKAKGRALLPSLSSPRDRPLKQTSEKTA